MSQQRRKKISFVALKQISKPVKVEFYTKEGKKISFKGHAQIIKPVKVEFYVKRKKKK